MSSGLLFFNLSPSPVHFQGALMHLFRSVAENLEFDSLFRTCFKVLKILLRKCMDGNMTGRFSAKGEHD